VWTVDRMIRRGELSRGRKWATAQLSRDELEHLALTTRTVRQLVADPASYWVTRRGAAEVMGISQVRVGQLTAADRII